MRAWQLQEAKARLSELVKLAVHEGPQEISVRGRPAVVVISREDYGRSRKPKTSFVAFMRGSPLRGLELRREQTPTRRAPS